MGRRQISQDLKAAALRLCARGDSDQEIIWICNFSLSTLTRIRRRHHRTGSTAHDPAIRPGRPRVLVQADSDFLIALARHNPTLFLDEYAKRLATLRHLPASLSTLHRSFIRAGLRLKQVQKLALERDPIKRADFMRRVGRHPPQALIFLDEVSKDDRTYSRLWGRAPSGRRVNKHDPFVRGRRLSMLAALALDEGIVAARVLQGSFTRKTFLEYLHDDLVSVHCLSSCIPTNSSLAAPHHPLSRPTQCTCPGQCTNPPL